MQKQKAFSENGLLFLALLVTSVLFVTIVGYFDEGNHLIFANFADYLFQGGNPPLSDYLLWSGIFVVLGITLFHAQSLIPALRTAVSLRLFLAILGIPALVGSILILLPYLIR